jgi:hypothetical protein
MSVVLLTPIKPAILSNDIPCIKLTEDLPANCLSCEFF